ncbi:SIMPL domain-containing protein [Calothrix rhizosoleniae]|uniref:SIMPL domain-containing protein n=1 Tax=Calothrix rhizosoleniae TaxID=888997 RepID=UPI000B49D08E|nr:SIMPL domain-containing protein [Calothrix rhizosoleniae]
MSTLALQRIRSCLPHTWQFFSVALVTYLICTPPALSQKQAQIPRTLTVNGRGMETVATSHSQVNVGIEIQAKTAADAQKQVAMRSSAVVKYLKDRKVEKLQTTGISLTPVYKYTNNTQQLIGYKATNRVSFRVDTDKIGNILDGVVKAGATQINNINFMAKEEAIATARKKALQAATQDAQSQAQTVLTSLNLTAKEVVNITINSGSTSPPPIFRANVAASRTEASTPVIGGEQQVQASVTLTISY